MRLFDSYYMEKIHKIQLNVSFYEADGTLP